MRGYATIFVVLVFCLKASPRDRRVISPPRQFEIGRHTFFDFGPPFDFYELLVVRPAAAGTSVQRITLTPSSDKCSQSATVEVTSTSMPESVAKLFGQTNPCLIPEKELRRELKRCKKCLVFSGANIAIQVQCGSQTRIIRSDILDKDMFDPAPNTPEHTSWTMALLARLDAALGPGVMDKPVFPTGKSADAPAANSEAEILSEIGVGKFDELFRGAPDKPSDLYRASHSYPASPTVRLLSSTPFQPVAYVQPEYPPLAKFAHVSGSVIFDLVVDSNGKASNFAVESGQPLLRGAVEKSVANWKFPNEAAGQKIHATIEFATNCSPNPSKR